MSFSVCGSVEIGAETHSKKELQIKILVLAIQECYGPKAEVFGLMYRMDDPSEANKSGKLLTEKKCL